MILWVALASVFSVLLGASRVPYSAALDENFFPVFARLHPTKHFPHVSLLVLGGLAFLFSVTLKLQTAIVGILAVRLVVQFIGQAVGVILLRRQLQRDMEAERARQVLDNDCRSAILLKSHSISRGPPQRAQT